MFGKLILIILCIVTYSLSSPVSTEHDDDFVINPMITETDLEVIKQLKRDILYSTEPTDKIIFVGNTPSYVYYSFSPTDNRDVNLVPVSGRWMSDFRKASKAKEGIADSIIADPISNVKQYCANFIDPMRLNSNEKIVLVDFSVSGDGVFEVIKDTPFFIIFSSLV